jgi:putative transposase
MPNHIHVVIEIDSNLSKTVQGNSEPIEIVKIKSISQIMGAGYANKTRSIS